MKLGGGWAPPGRCLSIFASSHDSCDGVPLNTQVAETLQHGHVEITEWSTLGVQSLLIQTSFTGQGAEGEPHFLFCPRGPEGPCPDPSLALLLGRSHKAQRHSYSLKRLLAKEPTTSQRVTRPQKRPLSQPRGRQSHRRATERQGWQRAQVRATWRASGTGHCGILPGDITGNGIGRTGEPCSRKGGCDGLNVCVPPNPQGDVLTPAP